MGVLFWVGGLTKHPWVFSFVEGIKITYGVFDFAGSLLKQPWGV